MELILLTVAVVCLAIYLWSRRTDSRLPPFPRTPLPIVGNLFHVDPDSRTQFRIWRKQCGDIFSINVMGTLIVVLNGFEAVKEAFVKNANAFSDRTPVFIDKATGLPGKGVMFSSGHNWKEQRSVSLTILRKFGMGKNIMAEKVQEEVSCYVNYLISLKGKPVDIRVMTNISASNIICSVIIGHRFDYDDEVFQRIIMYVNAIASDQENMNLINFLPWLKYLPGDFFKAKQVTRNVQAVFSLLNKFIVEKSQDDINTDEAEHFIHAYIIELNKKIQAGIPTYMDEGNLKRVIVDLFNAGTETTSTTIYWCVLYMINHPDIQEKVFREIKEVVGTERIPNMQDRSNLPYLNAVILETQRLGSIVPLSLVHMCSEDTELQGYTIPKGAYVVPNLDSVLHDKKIWGEDALTFKPERFLDANGKLQDREELIPFGIGRRICLGEAMAKMELFLFLSNMFQKFRFLPKDKTPPSYSDYVFGITCAPQFYEVRMVERA